MKWRRTICTFVNARKPLSLKLEQPAHSRMFSSAQCLPSDCKLRSLRCVQLEMLRWRSAGQLLAIATRPWSQTFYDSRKNDDNLVQLANISFVAPAQSFFCRFYLASGQVKIDKVHTVLGQFLDHLIVNLSSTQNRISLDVANQKTCKTMPIVFM